MIGGRHFEFSTLTMSPALDSTIFIDSFPAPGDVLKGKRERRSPGGKGLNCARWFSVRGHSCAATGILGASNAGLFEELMRSCGIEDMFVRVSGESRTNVMFTSPQGMFKINRPAFPDLDVSEFDEENLLRCCAKADVCVLTGSLPPAVDPGLYRRLTARLHAIGVRVVLDAAGEALVQGLEAAPDIVKPNVSECADVLGFKPGTEEEFLFALRELGKKAGLVILSSGEGGCWFYDARHPDEAVHAPSPNVSVLDTTAAGDTLLAEFCGLYFPDCVLSEESIKRTVAAGAAATEVPGAVSPDPERVDTLSRSVRPEYFRMCGRNSQPEQ